MESLGKVIYLPTAGNYPYNGLINSFGEEPIAPEEEESLLEKAKKVLEGMEELWEMDHCAVKLRDEFHLLRHYLNRLPKRACDDLNKQK